MESAANRFDHVVERLSRDYAPIERGVVERILIEEHDLLTGLQPGDIVAGIVVEATVERLARLRCGGASAELA